MNDYIHDKVVKWFYDHEELLIAIMNKTPYQSDGWDYEIEVVNEFLTTEQRCYCGDIYTLGVIHRDDGPCHYPDHKEPEQEPVACTSLCVECTKRGDWVCAKAIPPQRKPDHTEDNLEMVEKAGPLFSVAPQRTWVGLTIQEANELWESTDSDWELMKRTEAKLKEKNK